MPQPIDPTKKTKAGKKKPVPTIEKRATAATGKVVKPKVTPRGKVLTGPEARKEQMTNRFKNSKGVVAGDYRT